MSPWRLGTQLIILSAFAPAGRVLALGPVGTAFSFQGQLRQSGVDVNDVCDFEFRLFDSPVGGTQIGPTLTFDGAGGNPLPVEVVEGLLGVTLDFGVGVFEGDARFLEISVRCPSGVGAYEPLSPRAPILATPYALYALDAPGGFGLPFFAEIDRPEDGFAIINNIGRALAGSSPDSDAVYGLTDGGVALHGQTTGSGYAVHGEADNDGTAIRGDTSSGVGVQGNAGDGTGVHAESADGVALRARSFSTATGVHATTMLNSAGIFEIIDTLGSNTADALTVSNNSGGDSFVARTNGSGRAGYFEISADPNNPNNTGPNTANAVEAITDADGSAGRFEISNSNSVAPALVGVTDGRGSAGEFETAPGGGQAQSPTISATNRGQGPAATLKTTLTTNGDATLRIENAGASNGALLIADDPNNIEPVLRARHEGSGSAALLEIADSFGQATNNAATAARVKTRGLGSAARIEIENAANNSTALVVATDGPGSAGTFTSAAGPTLNAFNAGAGSAVVAGSGSGSAIVANAGSGAAATLTSSGTLNATLEVENLGDGIVGAFTSSLTSMADTIQVLHQGPSGSAGAFEVNGPSNASAAIFAQNDGTGPGGVFRNYRIFAGPSTNPEPALRAYGNAVGGVADFELENTASNAVALEVTTKSAATGKAAAFTSETTQNTAPALEATHHGRGQAGSFTLTRQDNDSSALTAVTDGMGIAGEFRITNDDDFFMISEAPAVLGHTLGFAQGGLFEIDRPFTGNQTDEENTAAPALHGKTNGGGPAGLFERISPSVEATGLPALKATSNTRDPVAEFVATDNMNDEPVVVAMQMGSGPAARFDATASQSSTSDAVEIFASNNGSALFARQLGDGYAIAARQNGAGGLARFDMDPNSAGGNVDAVLIDASTVAHALRVKQQHLSGKIAKFEANTPVAAVDAVTIDVNNARHSLYVQQTGTGESAHFENVPPNANNCVFISNNHTTGRALVVNNLLGTGMGGLGLALQVNGRSEFNGHVLANAGLFVQSGELCAQSVCAAVKQFKIDHPLDPANKYLHHASVESDEMKNMYDGMVVTDSSGRATVELPAWFEALNTDFRYQLTVIDEADGDEFVLAKVVEGVKDNRFRIRTSRPGVAVCWQVTGARQDAYARSNPLRVEEDKPDEERGRYLNPIEHGQPMSLGIQLAPRRGETASGPEAAADAEQSATSLGGRDHVSGVSETTAQTLPCSSDETERIVESLSTAGR